MILTFTANPSIDKTARLEKLLCGELNRLDDVTIDYAGKGINVAKVVKALGGEATALALMGTGGGEAFRQDLDGAGIPCGFVWLEGPVRTNLKVMDDDGRLTELNEPGLPTTAEDWDRAEALVLSHLSPKDVLVLSGSLPPGAPVDIYYRLCEKAKELGAAVVLDAEGRSFIEALKAQPDVIKPNQYELLSAFGLPADSPRELVVAQCQRLIDDGVRLVALSMGADGALFISADKIISAPALDVELFSPVGAGDSMVAALALATQQGISFVETATLAMAAGAAAVTTAGTKPPSPQLVETLKTQVRFV